MSSRVLLVSAAACVVGALALVLAGWLAASMFLVAAVWLVVVERTVGVGTFVRFDPWRPETRRARRRRTGLVTGMLVATLPAGIVVGLKYPDPAAFVVSLYVILAMYTVWASSFIKSYGVDEVVEVRVRD